MANAITQKIKDGALIIDVRTPDEFADGAYPGAKNIPLAVIHQRIGEFGDKTKPVIVYCASGGRSAAAKSVLASYGYTDVTNAGGLDDMP